MPSETATPVTKLILDSGAGADLAWKQDFSNADLAKAIKLPRPIVLDTAGGDVTVTHVLPIRSDALRGVVTPLLCESSPAALSLGVMCAKRGFGFYWSPYATIPSFYDPKGHPILLRVDQNVPFVHAKDKTHGGLTAAPAGPGPMVNDIGFANRNPKLIPAQPMDRWVDAKGGKNVIRVHEEPRVSLSLYS